MGTNPGALAPLQFSAVDRHEPIGDINISGLNTSFSLPGNGGNLPNDRYMYGILLRVEMRVTMPANGEPTAILPDAPWSVINLISVKGTHRVRNQVENFILARGSDLYRRVEIYRNSQFFKPSQLGGAFGPAWVPNIDIRPNAINDLKFDIYVPFTPMNLPLEQQTGYLFDAPNYDNPQLNVTFADDKSLFSGQTTAPTFTAFGSATGNPKIRVLGEFALGGAGVFGFIPARTWLQSVETSQSELTNNGATTTNVRLFNVPRGNVIRSIMVKSGVKGTPTAGNDVYSSLTDDALTNIKLQRGLNKSIRNYIDFNALKQETYMRYRQWPSAGYALLDFAKNGRLKEALNTVGLIAGPSGDTDVFIQSDVLGATGQAVLFLTEEIRGIPRRLNG